MSNPSPRKIAQLVAGYQAAWPHPEKRLADSPDFDFAVLTSWKAKRQEVLDVQGAFVDLRGALATFEDRFLLGRDAVLWTHDRTAGLSLPLIADALGLASDDLANELFRGVSPELALLLVETRPSWCPLCKGDV